jgi:hypothetical protein
MKRVGRMGDETCSKKLWLKSCSKNTTLVIDA